MFENPLPPFDTYLLTVEGLNNMNKVQLKGYLPFSHDVDICINRIRYNLISFIKQDEESVIKYLKWCRFYYLTWCNLYENPLYIGIDNEKIYIKEIIKWIDAKIIEPNRKEPPLPPDIIKDVPEIDITPFINENNPKEEVQQIKTLFDIWLPDVNGNKEQQYNLIIVGLQNTCWDIDSSFVKKVNKKLHWNKGSIVGWQQYMAGFIYTCIINNWIADEYSSTEFVTILENTFNVKPNKKPFKGIIKNPPQEKYLKPFKFITKNSNK